MTASPYTGRAVPWSQDAEQAVLASMLIDNRAILRALRLVEAGMFYSQAHATVFSTVVRLLNEGSVADVLTLADRLERDGALDQCGGRDYLSGLTDAIPTAANVEHYARIVREKAVQRRVIEVASDVAEQAFSGQLTAQGLLEYAQARMLAATPDTTMGRGYVPASTAIYEAYEDAERRASGDTASTIKTGVPAIDGDPVGGLEPGDLVTWVMVSGHGKTAAMAQVSLRAALAGTGVGFVSAEMVRRQIARRWAALLTGIEFARLKKWSLSAAEIARATYAAGVVSTLPLWIDDTGTPSLAHVLQQARQLKAQHASLGIIVVDYLTLIQGEGTTAVERYGQAVRALKKLAKELGVAVVGLVQPDARSIERRGASDGGPMPQLADIAWCQEFRNQSDLIVCGYRPGQAGETQDDTVGRFATLKNRNGGAGQWSWSWWGAAMAYDRGCWEQLDALMAAAPDRFTARRLGVAS